MWDNILSMAINNGLWAGLFVGLMVYILRDSDKREKKYQEIIGNLTSRLVVVEEIKQDAKEIKKDVIELKFKSRSSICDSNSRKPRAVKAG